MAPKKHHEKEKRRQNRAPKKWTEKGEKKACPQFGKK